MSMIALSLLISLSLTSFTMLPRGERLTERKLDGTAVIKLPASIKEEMFKGLRTEQPDRLMFTFGSSYLWASFGSITRYKQLLVISLMARDASPKAYTTFPNAFVVSPTDRRLVRSTTKGTTSVTVSSAVYEVGTRREPSNVFEYRDRARRLQIIWHAVDKEMSLADGVQFLDAIAASFRLVDEPVASFAETRDRPEREANEHARKLAVAQRMLAEAGFGGLVPGRPSFKNGMYVEWMSDPEPRFQLLVPLGRVLAAAADGGISPRPMTPKTATGDRALAGTIGWRAFTDSEWRFNNGDDDYLPFVGIGALLSAKYHTRGEVLYYYVATVRVEESEDNRLTSLRWFTDGIPAVQRLWSEGKLVPGHVPVAPARQE